MYRVTIPTIGSWDAWRDAARAALSNAISPEQIDWHFGTENGGLFDGTDLPSAHRPIRLPESYVSLAEKVIWHSDRERFARLYALAWRLRHESGVIRDTADPQIAHLRRMEKAVRRCQHKMKAFVRFRDLRQTGDRRAFAAWFEPTHHTVEPTAGFFARRFADMNWMIVTPDVTARFVAGEVSFHAGQAKPDLPDDATEELWGTYFCNIFNPARLKVQAMTSEMPKKYWKNMPEARHIPDLIAGAEAKVAEMRAKAPTLPPERVAAIRAQLTDRPQPASWNMLDAGLLDCDRCPLHCHATQVVRGEGPRNAGLLIVGEQPGEAEDLAGRPFVGPAGQLFDQMAERAGLDRKTAYVTNAVKHFKFVRRGKRRIHQNPNSEEISHCRFWLESEIALVKPQLILAMGGTAAEALTGSRKDLLKRRGKIEMTGHGPVFITVHPSYLLRLPPDARPDAEQAFEIDLRHARDHLATTVA